MRARTQSLSLPPASVDTRLLTSRDNCKPLMAGCDRRCASLHLWIYRSITWMGMNLVVAAALGMSMMSAAATSSSDATTAVQESGHCDLTRSLGATIMASLSTLALFGAANWGHGFMFDTSLVDRIGSHIVFSYLNPGLSFFFTFCNSMAVWKHNNNMVPPPLQDSYHRSTIAIITNCPIFIPILVSLDSSILADLLDALGLKKDDLLSREQVDESCPLELSPATGGSAAAANYSTPASSTANYPSPQLMRRTHSDSVLVSHQQHDDLPDNISLPQMKFLKLKDDVFNANGRKELLELGLIPKQEQLRFQEVVACFQACGYVLGVALRVFQRLPISPLEAVLTILCILVVCQTALSIYACSNFQRPLLLRLDQQQFVQWSQHIITARRNRQDPPVNTISWRRAVVGFWVSAILLFAIPSIYYTVRPAQHFSLSCVFSALLFLSYAIFMFTFLAAIFMLPAPYDDWIGFPLLFLAMAAFFSSILLALISTIKDWYIFDQRTENSFAWILPHVSPTR